MKFGDILGRRLTIFVSAVTATIGAVLMASSFSLAQLIVSRLILGFGGGGLTGTIPSWQSEISGAEHRGAFVNAEGIFLGLGITIACAVDLGFYFIDGNSVSWRFPFALQIVFLLAVMAFIFTLPESPRWLVKKGRVDEAAEILAILKDTTVDSVIVRQDIETIQHSLTLNAGRKSAFGSLLERGPQRIPHRAMIACLGQLFQQICGVSVTVTYATIIYEQHLGFGAVVSRGLTLAMLSLHMVGGAISVLLIDRVGRRPLMLVSAIVMTICTTVLAGATSRPNNVGGLYASAVFLFLYTLFFAIGFLRYLQSRNKREILLTSVKQPYKRLCSRGLLRSSHHSYTCADFKLFADKPNFGSRSNRWSLDGNIVDCEFRCRARNTNWIRQYSVQVLDCVCCYQCRYSANRFVNS